MKLTTVTIVSVDGVMQGLGVPDEDRSGGFERGGWVTPLFDNEAMAFLNQVYQRADACVFGRRTYEIFAGQGGARYRPRGSRPAGDSGVTALDGDDQPHPGCTWTTRPTPAAPRLRGLSRAGCRDERLQLAADVLARRLVDDLGDALLS